MTKCFEAIFFIPQQRSSPLDNNEALTILETLYEKTYDRKFEEDNKSPTPEVGRNSEPQQEETEEELLAKELEMQLQAELEEKK